MVQFLDNTIYTDYALNKICENLVEDISNFNFIKVKVGSGDNTLYQSRTDLSTLLYSLVIQDVVYDNEQGILTIICELPPELADIPITEIGLYDTVMGFDHLFSYSKVNIVKPSDIGYELTIVLNLGPKTIDFPGINKFVVPEYEYATAESLGNFTDTFIFITTNLERVIRSNAGEIGRNMAEVAYRRQKEIESSLLDTSYSNLYYSLHTKFIGNISDLFFINQPKYLSYKLCNFCDENSWLETYNKLWISNKDNLTFHKGPITLLLNAKFDDLSVESTVINKKNDIDIYFSVDIKQNYEEYMTYHNENNETAQQAGLFSELVISMYSLSEVYEVRYVFDMLNAGQYTNQPIPYILTFNGDFTNPEIHFYVNGEEPELFVCPEKVEPSLDVQAGVLPSDSDEEKARKREVVEETLKQRAYGKIIVPQPVTVLNDMPDNDYIGLKNYNTYYDNEEKVQYDNALGISSIMTLKKQVNKHELAFLTNTFSTMGNALN